MKISHTALVGIVVLWVGSICLTAYLVRRTVGSEVAKSGLAQRPSETTGSRADPVVAGAVLSPVAAGRPLRLEEDSEPVGVADELHGLVVDGTPRAYGEMTIRLSELSAGEAADAFEFLSGCSRTSTVMWQALWRRWGAVDLEGALAHATAQDGGVNGDAIKQIFAGLGEEAPRQAVDYLSSHPDLPGRGKAIEGVSVRWAIKDLEGVTSWALDELDGDDRSSALYAIPWAINLQRGDGSELDWWRSLPDREIQEAAYAGLRDIYNNFAPDPENQIALAQAGLQAGITDPSVLRHVGRLLGAEDPERGIGILTTGAAGSDDGGDAYAGVEALFLTWGRLDPLTAGERLTAALDQPWAETAILGYAHGIREIDPEAAEQWMSQLEAEPETRP